MSTPLLTLEETLQELRIAAAARDYVRRSEEMARLLVESEGPLDPKVELRCGEAWGRLLDAVKATGPPTEKQGRRVTGGPVVFALTPADSITAAAAGQARSCLRETPLVIYVRRKEGARRREAKGASSFTNSHE